MKVKKGYADFEGARIYYEDAGEGRPVVLIHGGSLDRRMWDPQFERFAKSTAWSDMMLGGTG